MPQQPPNSSSPSPRTPIQPLQPPRDPSISPRGKTLVAVVGTAAAATLLWFIPTQEGTKYKAYRDSVGVLTICEGDTHNVKVGEVDNPAQCQDRLAKQLLAHSKEVMQCIDPLSDKGADYPRIIASLAYNVGGSRVCRSTAAAYMRKRDWPRGCGAMVVYDKAGGKILHGLSLRRRREIQICLTGMVPGLTAENMKARVLEIH